MALLAPPRPGHCGHHILAVRRHHSGHCRSALSFEHAARNPSAGKHLLIACGLVKSAGLSWPDSCWRYPKQEYGCRNLPALQRPASSSYPWAPTQSLVWPALCSHFDARYLCPLKGPHALYAAQVCERSRPNHISALIQAAACLELLLLSAILD